MDTLQAEVEAAEGAEASALALLQGLTQQLEDAIAVNHPSAVPELVEQLKASTDALAAAVAANPLP